MRFAFQPGVEEGVLVAEPRLARLAEVLAREDDWTALDPEALALGLVLGDTKRTTTWLESLAVTDPPRALDLALIASRFSLRIGCRAGRICRIPTATTTARVCRTPEPEFWRELRRSIDCDPSLRHKISAVASLHSPVDLRLRAGLAHILPEEAWWSEFEQARASLDPDPDFGAAVLLAAFRHDALSTAHVQWPPPRWALDRIEPKQAGFVARSLRPLSAGSSLLSLRRAFRDLTRSSAMATIARTQPTRELVRRARSFATSDAPAHVVLRAAILARWDRAVASSSDVPPGRDEVRIRSALRLNDEPALEAVSRSASADWLSRVAGDLFLQWMLDGRPVGGRWAARAVGRFPSDPWAAALAQFASEWSELPDGDASLALQILGAMSTPASARALLAIRTVSPAIGVEAESQVAMVATKSGLDPGELEARLFPSFDLPEGATVRLEAGLRVVVSTRNVQEVDTAWQAALDALPRVVADLERRMLARVAMSALHFTETWAMHPILSAVARRLVWGVFRRGTRVSIVVPGRDAWPVLDPDDHVRPILPDELSESDLLDARALLGGVQPFVQLERGASSPHEVG